MSTKGLSQIKKRDKYLDKITEKIKSVRWKKFEVILVKNGLKERLGSEKDWGWIKQSYEFQGSYTLVSETENQLKYLQIEELMVEIVNGEEIKSDPIEMALILQKS